MMEFPKSLLVKLISRGTSFCSPSELPCYRNRKFEGNRIPCRQNGGQPEGWGCSVHYLDPEIHTDATWHPSMRPFCLSAEAEKRLCEKHCVSDRTVIVSYAKYNELHDLTEEWERFFCCQNDLLVIVSINIFKMFNNSYSAPR